MLTPFGRDVNAVNSGVDWEYNVMSTVDYGRVASS